MMMCRVHHVRTTSLILLASIFPLAGGNCQNGMNMNPNGNGLNPFNLTIVKVGVNSTTSRGPAIGDGVIAFNANGNAELDWLRVGETTADVKVVPAPSGMDNDDTSFQFQGKKLVVKDRTTGHIYVFDTETNNVQSIPYASVNITTGTWAGDGKWVGSINATVTTADGPHQLIKVTDISDINAFVTMAFDDPDQSPEDITVDATSHRIAVRTTSKFFIYDIGTAAPIHAWELTSVQGGVGSGTEIKLRGDYLAFFNDDDLFSVLNVNTGTSTRPARNPGRSGAGLDIGSGVFAYFAAQTDDDGSTISNINRALVGNVSDFMNLTLDPAGAFINGDNATDGRVGFGLTLGVSPTANYVAVAGAPPVGVGTFERLYLSANGNAFRPVADTADPTGFLGATGVAVSDNLVAFLISSDPGSQVANVQIGYAVLP